jgi:hypothetical protein
MVYLNRFFILINLILVSTQVLGWTCPPSVSFSCVPADPKECRNREHMSLCTFSGSDQAWHFIASTARLVSHGSTTCSTIPPGNYMANHGFSYYGEVVLDESSSVNAAACYYFMPDRNAAGLYSTNYIYDPKQSDWVNLGGRYFCQNVAANCHFIRQ